jgi:hypothetical protein
MPHNIGLNNSTLYLFIYLFIYFYILSIFIYSGMGCLIICYIYTGMGCLIIFASARLDELEYESEAQYTF